CTATAMQADLPACKGGGTQVQRNRRSDEPFSLHRAQPAGHRRTEARTGSSCLFATCGCCHQPQLIFSKKIFRKHWYILLLSCVFMVTNMNMQDERFWTLVSLKLNDEAGPEELAELEKLLILHPERGMQVQVLQSLWKSAAPAVGRQSFDRHMQRLSNHLSEPVLQFEDEAVETEPVVTTSPV